MTASLDWFPIKCYTENSRPCFCVTFAWALFITINYTPLRNNKNKNIPKIIKLIMSEIEDLGLKKKPGCSWIEVDNNFHIFTAGDRSHSQSDEIYAAVESLTIEIQRAGYIPQIYWW